MPATKINADDSLIQKQSPNSISKVSCTSGTTTSEDYLNKKIAFIQNHINNLLIEITNLPEPWTYAVTEDGRVFFINENEQRTTWLHPVTGQPVSVMIIPPLEDLPTGWQKDYILGLPYLIDHNSRQNFINSTLAKAVATTTANSNNSNYSNKTHLSLASSSSSSAAGSPKKVEENCLLADHLMANKMKYKYNTDSESPSTGKFSDTENHNLDNNITSSSSTSSAHSSSMINSNNNNNNNVNIAVDSALRKYGWLYKLSQNGFKLWRKRYFVLTDYILDYYSDSTMNKHCGTIFLNGTRSRATVKKDGGSANNKKYSFKVELLQSDNTNGSDDKPNGNKNCAATNGVSLVNDMYIYLAADSTTSMNEWINKFNFVSKLKDNSGIRNGLSDKQFGTLSNRSASISSLKSSSNNFIIKHDNSSQKSSKSKSNSAPSSPNLIKSNQKSTNKSSESKIRSSISTTSNIKQTNVNDNGHKKIIKKLAFSDDEIINDKQSLSSKKDANKKLKNQSNENEKESENLTDLLNENDEKNSKNINNHKRSSSLTKSMISTSNKQQSNKNGSSVIYDYKSIYDAFEKPTKETTDSISNLSNNQKPQNITRPTMSQKNDKYKMNETFIDSNKQQPNQPLLDTYLSSEKMAAASAAAMAAAAAIKKEKDLQQKNHHASMTSSIIPAPKIVNNFYAITRAQIELLPKNEVQMLIRQLRRNFVLLNHSQQRFTLLHKLFEPYELIYQHKQSHSQNDTKSDDTLTQCLHDSYKTMRERIIKVEMRMDSVEDSLKLAQQFYDSVSPSSLSDDYGSTNSSKYSSYFRLYEYQIVEMQHEYELLLEDKIIIDKLLDNQIKIFSIYKNLSSEKTLIQQFNALNQEMDLLKLQLTKINQLLNDTIAEKCKQELKHHQQQMEIKNKKGKNHAESLFRADLVPIGNVMTSSNTRENEQLNSSSNLWKLNTNNKQNSNSNENLTNIQKNTSVHNYSQLLTPKSNPLNKSNNFNPNHHYYCLNNDSYVAKPITNLKMDSNISKSIDSIYTPPSSSNSSNNNNNQGNLTSSLVNGSAFNMTKKSTVNDELEKSFQPISFCNNRQKQHPPLQQPSTGMSQTLQQQTNRVLKETRDFIAEKKRASIGKYPNNLNYQYFQPIPVQHCQPASCQQSTQSMNSNSSSTINASASKQQSARERLFGSVNSNSIYNQQQHQHLMNSIDMSDQMNNNRKIAMVKPELRGSCENELIQRFTQQNQMEYFDADYSEEIAKNINKPDIFSIPRGNLDLEPEIELTEEEIRAKEKRMLEIKKMIALQSLQQIFIDDINNYSGNYFKSNKGTNSYADLLLEKEKRAREQLLDLRHEVAEQIKEKTRQTMSTSLNGSNNGLSSTPPSTSIPIEIDHKSNELKQTYTIDTPPDTNDYIRHTDQLCSSIDKKRQQLEHDYYSMQMMSESVLNSTPAPPTPNFHAIFNLNNYNTATDLNSLK